MDGVALAYSSLGLQVPAGLWAHSTRGLVTSWALFNGVSIQDICAAASWSTALTFARFYRLDVTFSRLAWAWAPHLSCLIHTSLCEGGWWSVVEISLSGNTGVSISHSEASKRMLWKRTVGYFRNPGFLSSISEMSHQTALLAAGVKREEVCLFWMMNEVGSGGVFKAQGPDPNIVTASQSGLA